jgi:riboflavin synthase
MFTGIVEEIGTMLHNKKQGQTLRITIQAKHILEDIHLGDSISINGVCLTVVAFNSHSFSVDCVPETVRKTNLKHVKTGSPVNLERAMSATGRFGGHIVQGHVDSTATILSRTPEENAIVFRLQPHQPEAMRLIVPTGSITVDGISLTVVEVQEAWFSIYIIPHTLAQTVLQHKKAGDEVNLECDMLAKYMERLLVYGQSHPSHRTYAEQTKSNSSSGSLSVGKLTEHGYI